MAHLNKLGGEREVPKLVQQSILYLASSVLLTSNHSRQEHLKIDNLCPFLSEFQPGRCKALTISRTQILLCAQEKSVNSSQRGLTPKI